VLEPREAPRSGCERALAEVARAQATALEQTGQANPLATKELIYATRRLGGE